MAQSKNQLANLKHGNPETQIKSGRDAVEKQRKSVESRKQNRRRHKTMQETVLMVLKQPMDDIGKNKAKRSGIDISNIDEYDMTALTSVVIGQVRSAANGNSQAAQNVAEWMDLAVKHRQDALEIEKRQAEIEKLKAEIERLRAGLGAEDDDMVLQFVEGMKETEGGADDTPDAEAD